MHPSLTPPQQSTDRLAEAARSRLCAYIYTTATIAGLVGTPCGIATILTTAAVTFALSLSVKHIVCGILLASTVLVGLLVAFVFE